LSELISGSALWKNLIRIWIRPSLDAELKTAGHFTGTTNRYLKYENN